MAIITVRVPCPPTPGSVPVATAGPKMSNSDWVRFLLKNPGWAAKQAAKKAAIASVAGSVAVGGAAVCYRSYVVPDAVLYDRPLASEAPRPEGVYGGLGTYPGGYPGGAVGGGGYGGFGGGHGVGVPGFIGGLPPVYGDNVVGYVPPSAPPTITTPGGDVPPITIVPPATTIIPPGEVPPVITPPDTPTTPPTQVPEPPIGFLFALIILVAIGVTWSKR